MLKTQFPSNRLIIAYGCLCLQKNILSRGSTFISRKMIMLVVSSFNNKRTYIIMHLVQRDLHDFLLFQQLQWISYICPYVSCLLTFLDCHYIGWRHDRSHARCLHIRSSVPLGKQNSKYIDTMYSISTVASLYKQCASYLYNVCTLSSIGIKSSQL